MNTSETLNRAADLIESRGWRRGTWGDPNDGAPLCLEGALIAAIGLRRLDVAALQDCPAYLAVMDYLHRPLTTRILPHSSRPYLTDALYLWNDDPRRTQAEVIEVLRAAAAIEEARESAAIIAGAELVEVVSL